MYDEDELVVVALRKFKFHSPDAHRHVRPGSSSHHRRLGPAFLTTIDTGFVENTVFKSQDALLRCSLGGF
nr:hypothetical protein CFP56_71895 [Quercus suber]